MEGQPRRKTLSTIDPNHLSAIPQPSARKPSRSSQLPPSAYSNPHHQRQSSYGEGRLSYAPASSQGAGASSQQRRSSTYTPGHRNSSIGGIGVLSQNISQAPNKDPRPIRDKQFKEQSIHKIINYLQDSGYPQHVVPKTLMAPTQKEFVSVFQYLYHKFDPNFQFVKKIEEDVIYCLKAIKYPFSDTISRSQVTAAGSPHTWSNMLAALTWMVETLVVLDRLLKNEIPVEDNEADNPDKLYFNHFLTKAYQVFLAGADDYSEMERELEHESDRQNESTLTEVERLEDDNERLEKELHDLNASQPPLQALHQEREILISDKTKFKDYIARLDQKRARVADSNVKLAQMLEEAEAVFESMGRDKVQLQEQVDAQDISATDVEKMNSEHEALIKNLEAATSQLQEASSQVFEKERLAQSKMDALDKAIQTYN
ncbi:Kinetochore protein ndc80, partial [Taphrina deformans PYCC 5710]